VLEHGLIGGRVLDGHEDLGVHHLLIAKIAKIAKTRSFFDGSLFLQRNAFCAPGSLN
jgi:hypothetical protein